MECQRLLLGCDVLDEESQLNAHIARGAEAVSITLCITLDAVLRDAAGAFQCSTWGFSDDEVSQHCAQRAFAAAVTTLAEMSAVR